MNNRRLSPVLLFVFAAFLGALSPPRLFAADVNSFTEVVGTVEAQRLRPGAGQLVYWDPIAADAVGIRAPAGRPGDQSLSPWAVEKMGWEIRDASRTDPVENILHVEKDSFGGSGRAAYLEVEPGVWVNIKGVGITGYGRTSHLRVGPPSDKFSSHKDGSATLAEAIKEAVFARVGDNETSRGASRVIAIIATGRMLHYEDGGTAPEALIIRAPMKRADQAMRADEIIDTLAELNAKRFLKGDFVNTSNIGTHGQLVDFGCLTHTCDYVSAKSSQGARLLTEYQQVYLNEWFHTFAPAVHELGPTRFAPSHGRYLANQVGIPEAHLGRISEEMYRSFGEAFIALAEKESIVLIDNDPVPKESFVTRAKYREWMKHLAADYFENPKLTKPEFVAKLSARQGQIEMPIKKISENFFAAAYDVFREIGVQHPETLKAGYGEPLARVAEFKLRDVPEILRPDVYRRSNDAASAYHNDKNPAAIQDLIDGIVARNHVTTGAVADSLFTYVADDKVTRVHIRAARSEKGKHTVFTHPEVGGPVVGTGDQAFFRVSADNWQSYVDYPAKIQQVRGFPEFVIAIPHGDKLPVTDQPLKLAPFWKTAAGEVKWPTTGKLDYTAPALFLNERLGLPKDLSRAPDLMRDEYGVHVRPNLPEPRRPARRFLDGCARLYSNFHFEL